MSNEKTRLNSVLAREIGSQLRKIRNAQDGHLTQADVADYAGISTRYYTYLELGEKMPSFEVIMKIAAAYRMSLSEFCRYFDNIL